MGQRESVEPEAERSPDDATREEAVTALRALILASEQFRHAVATHLGIGLSDTIAMSHLAAAGPLTGRQLADRVGLTPSTITALVDRLETAGLAQRVRHHSDRRSILIAITDEGHRALHLARHWLHTAMDGMDHQQLTDLSENLIEIAHRLHTQTAATHPLPDA